MTVVCRDPVRRGLVELMTLEMILVPRIDSDEWTEKGIVGKCPKHE